MPLLLLPPLAASSGNGGNETVPSYTQPDPMPAPSRTGYYHLFAAHPNPNNATCSWCGSSQVSHQP